MMFSERKIIKPIPETFFIVKKPKSRQQKIQDNKNIYDERLAGFTGTENYYKASIGKLKVTDGVHYFREKFNAFWLISDIDAVVSVEPKVRNEPFTVMMLPNER